MQMQHMKIHCARSSFLVGQSVLEDILEASSACQMEGFQPESFILHLR